MKSVLLLEKNSNSVVGVYNCEITIANIIITKSINRYFLFKSELGAYFNAILIISDFKMNYSGHVSSSKEKPKGHTN